MDNNVRSERELLSVVAYLYYYADMNQSDIANRLFISRSTVSRLIKKAKSSGVVELKINEPWNRDFALEDSLKTVLGVSGARVLTTEKNMTEDEALLRLGEIVSFYINCNTVSDTTLGVSWGNTFSHVVDSIAVGRKIPLTVVPIMGSLTWPNVNPESTEISYQFSKVYGAKYIPLDAPLYAASPEAKAELLEKSDVAAAIETCRNADMVLTSVASFDDIASEGIIDAPTLAKLKELGCIGRVGGHMYDISGAEIEGNFKELHIGPSMEDLKNVNAVLCVAGSEKKAVAVYGAVKAGIADILFVTDRLAEALLETARLRRI